jgi:hypothetical protein
MSLCSGCDVNRELHKYTGSITSINGSAITVQGSSLNGDGYYTGGLLIAPNGASRFITNQVSDIVTISRPIQGLLGSMDVDIYPGCDHLKETCLAKFNNLNNFGGFPWIPSRNPFDGSSII